MPPARRSKKVARKPRRAPPRKRKGGFVGRDASPVLDRYPPKDPQLSVRGPPRPAASAAAPGPAPPTEAAAPAPAPLIALERPFDIDEFSTLLGETAIQVTVPREDLGEVLRRVSEFMGFGIYVYQVTVRPTPGGLLKSFLVRLERVDFSPEKGEWTPFVEKGVSSSPFGPSGDRT